MNTNQGALYFGAGIDLNQWRRDVDSMRRDIVGLTRDVEKETRNVDSAFKNLSIGIAGYFSVSALKGFAMELINVRGEFQKTEIAFSTMLGSADKAKVLMGQMVDLAAKTPFGLEEVSAGAKQLLAFQIPANQVVDVLTRMGNIAAGLGVPLSRINLVYGQVKAKGKLMGDDLRQFTEAGIPMVAELAKKFNKTTGEIQEMVSAGKIGFKDVQDVLFNMTNEGGMFFNLMEKQSASLSGKVANLGDSWDQMLNKIGEGSEGILYSGIEGLTYLVEHYQDVLDIVETLIVAYGSYKAAVIVASAAQTFANKTVQSEIALLSISEKMKLGRAMVTQRQAEATAREAAAEVTNLEAKYAAMRVETSLLVSKKAMLRQTAVNTAAAVQEAKLKLSLAQLELGSIQATGTAREIELAQKRVAMSQNTLLATQETAKIARNTALANSTAIYNNREALKLSTQRISIAQNAAATASEAAQIAAKNANAIATTRLTIATRFRTAATQLATQAQVLLNATMLNNPIVLVIAAIAGLTYAYFRLRDTSTSLSIAEKQLNEERKRSSENIENLKNKTQELISVINSDTSTKLQQVEAYNLLSKMMPNLLKEMDLETFKKLGQTEAQKKLNAEIDKYSTQNIRNQVAAAQEKIQGFTNRINQLNEALKKRNGDSGIQLNELESAKKNLEAQKIILEKYNGELKERLFNEKISSMNLVEQKKYWEGQVSSITDQVSALEKSNVKKAQGIDKLNTMNSIVKSTSVGLLNWNITPLLSQLDRARNELNKINNAQSETGVNKNKAYWEQQKKAAEEANDAMSGRSADPKAWDANIKKYREANEQLKKYDYSDRELLKSQKERAKERLKLEKGAEKSYLEGSIKRYDQQISLLEEALSRSDGKNVRLRYIDKNGKERNAEEVRSVKSVQDEIVKLREERAEKEKLIEVKSFDEQLAETERQWKLKYKIAEYYGQKIADEQFPELKGSYYDDISKQFKELNNKRNEGAGLSNSEVLQWEKLEEILSSLYGEKDPLSNFNDSIDKALQKIASLDDQIEYLHNLRDSQDSKGVSLGYYAAADLKFQEKIQEQKNIYQQLLNDHKSYNQKRVELEQDAVKAINKIREDSTIAPSKKEELTKSIDKRSKEEISQLAVEELTQSKAWMSLYGNIDELTSYQMQILLEELESKKSNLAKVLTPVDFKILLKNFRDVKEKIIDENPFLGLFNSLQDMFVSFGQQSAEAGEQAFNGFERASEGIKGTLKAAKGIISTLAPAREYMSDAANDAIDTIEQVTTMGMVMMQAIDGTVKAVKSALDKASWSNWITAIISIIYTVIKAIVSLFSWIAGNKTKKINREIKSWQLAVDELKNSYEDLQRIIEKTAGEAQLTMQRQLIANLKEQQKILEQMRAAESKKKKADQDKIASYSNEIHAINVQIQQLVDDFKLSILTVEFKDVAQSLADALIDAFGQGEDAVLAFEKVVDEVMKNAVINALKIKFLQPVAEELVDKLYASMGFGSGATSAQSDLMNSYKAQLADLENKIKNGSVVSNLFYQSQKKAIEEKIKQLEAEIAANAMSGSFDGLSQEEIDLLKNGYKNDPRIQGFLEGIKNINELFDTTFESAQSLKGDIKGITEKTAGALEAQFNAVRINIVAMLQYAKQNHTVQNAHTVLLSQIEVNTRRLHSIDKSLIELNAKVKKTLAGVP